MIISGLKVYHKYISNDPSEKYFPYLSKSPHNYLDYIMSCIHSALFKIYIYWKTILGKGFPTHI